MKTSTSLLALAAASFVALAPVRAAAVVDNWTFATPAPWVSRDVASSAREVDALAFNVTAKGAPLTRVTQIAFQVVGPARNGQLANFQLVYHPDGLDQPGYVVASDSGSGWSPSGRIPSWLRFDLATPIVLQGDYSGAFVLRVDVNGVPSASFQARLQTVTVDDGTLRYLTETEDLPLQGDMFTLK